MEYAVIYDEHWGARLGRSLMAAMIAGMLVSFLVVLSDFLLTLMTSADPWLVVDGVAAWWSLILVGFVFAGILLALAAVVPLHIAMLRVKARGRGLMFLLSAAGAVGVGLGAMALKFEPLSMPLSLAALIAATVLAGIFFSAMLERWTWGEPCAS